MLEMLVEISYKKATMLYYYFPNFWVVNGIGLGGRKLGAECAPSGTLSWQSLGKTLPSVIARD